MIFCPHNTKKSNNWQPSRRHVVYCRRTDARQYDNRNNRRRRRNIDRAGCRRRCARVVRVHDKKKLLLLCTVDELSSTSRCVPQMAWMYWESYYIFIIRLNIPINYDLGIFLIFLCTYYYLLLLILTLYYEYYLYNILVLYYYLY